MENPSAKCPPLNDSDPVQTVLPNPEDCSSCYVCNSGKAILMPCPSGLHFNAQLGVCDWPESQYELGIQGKSPPIPSG